jgi:hypothetical protein
VESSNARDGRRIGLNLSLVRYRARADVFDQEDLHKMKQRDSTAIPRAAGLS